MTEYFKEVSKSQLTISTTFYPNPSGNTIVSYQDSHSRRYYQPYSGGNTEGYRTDNEYIEREMTLLKNAVDFVRTQVEASGIDYDHDDDGNIDNVCFIVQGQTDGWSDLLWPHRWVLYLYDVRIGGARVYDFNFQLSQALGVSVLCHEMFHSLGSPDLYRYEDTDITPVGPWDLMAHNKTPPQHMSAWMKMKYGKWFNEIPTISAAGNYSLKPLSTEPFAPNSTTEFFVVEYRRATGRFESSLVGSGLIIYRVNPSLEGNAEGPPDEVYVYRQGGTSRNNGNINNAPFSSSVGRTEFGDNTSPSCFLSTGQPGGIKISNIGAIGETITFSLGSGATTFNPPQALTASLTGSSVILGWQKPGAGNGTLSGFKVFRNNVVISTIGNASTLTYTDPNLSAGTYSYHVTATYVSPNGESVASNTVSVTVGGGAKPDLIIRNPVISPVNVESTGLVELSCTQVNQGDASAGYTMLRIYLSKDELLDSEDLQLASGTINALGPGESSEASGSSIEIPAGATDGKWKVIFMADADGLVAESIEDNNTAITELTIGNPSLNPPRELVALVSGQDVRLEWKYPEEGGGTLGGYYIYRNSVKVGTVDNPETFLFEDKNLTLGVHTYYVTAFYTAPVGESPKSNEVTVTVSSDAKPDLVIQDFTVTPTEVAPGGSIDITCRLLNIGGLQAGASLVQLYLSKDQTIDAEDTYLAYGTMDPIEPGGSIDISGEDITLPAAATSGTWYAIIRCDGENTVEETNETNNTAVAMLVVQGNSPDLEIASISFYPLVIFPKTNVRVTVIVSNSGNATASPVKVSFYLSTDDVLDASDLPLFTQSTRILGAKATINLSSGFTLAETILSGQYYLIGMADEDGSVAETNENNNVLIKAVTIIGTSGIEEFDLSGDLLIYPNPASNWVVISFINPDKRFRRLVVVNNLGQTVYQSDEPNRMNQSIRIDVKNWNKGFYVIRLFDSNGAVSKPLLIE
jgi:M6 family metalloprotease-like protein